MERNAFVLLAVLAGCGGAVSRSVSLDGGAGGPSGNSPSNPAPHPSPGTGQPTNPAPANPTPGDGGMSPSADLAFPPSSPGGSSASGGIRIVSFTSTVTSLTYGQSIQFVAIVTDSAGLDQLVGGKLVDDGGATYGGFDAGAQKGTYSLTLDWNAIHQVRALDFTPPGITRVFTAQFFDNLGAQATATLTVKFYCGENHDWAACDGVCTDLTNINSCGACGNFCGNLECVDGSCGCPNGYGECDGACANLSNDPGNCGACGNECVHQGQDGFCVEGVCACDVGSPCGNGCVDLTMDNDNCGACGHVCTGLQGNGSHCFGGTCIMNVLSTVRRTCNAVCADLGVTCVTTGNSAGGTVTYSGGSVLSVDCASVPLAVSPGNNQSFDYVMCECNRF